MNPIEPTPPACTRVRARLDELLDGALAPLEAARDRGHLEACESCAQAQERARLELERWRRALEPAGEEWARATEGLDARLRAAVAPRIPRLRPSFQGLGAGSPRSGLRAALLAAAAVLLLFGLGEFGILDLPTEFGRASAVARSLTVPDWSIDLNTLWEDKP